MADLGSSVEDFILRAADAGIILQTEERSCRWASCAIFPSGQDKGSLKRAKRSIGLFGDIKSLQVVILKSNVA